MRVDSNSEPGKSNHLHWHDGTTCHGAPTLEECATEAIKNGWAGKILMKEDRIFVNSDATEKCYSLIASSFEHHAKYGKYVAVIELTMRLL